MNYTPHQSRYFAEQIVLKRPQSSIDSLASAMSGVKVDLNPHQVDAALFAMKSPLSNGALMADEVGLGKTIEAGMVLAQYWSERKRKILLIVPASLRMQWRTELSEKFFIDSVIMESANFNRAKKEGQINPFEVNNQVVICSYNYMFYLRALDKDNKTTTPGVRKYYSANKFEKLFAENLMNNLSIILTVWRVVNKHEHFEEEAWTSNIAILQSLDTLSSYPNEFWKYPVVIFYLAHRNEKEFEDNFDVFLKKLLLELLTKYLITPTINAVKSDILKLNVEIIASARPKFEFKEIDDKQLEGRIRIPHRNAVRMLLKILAYEKQDSLLPDKWEIEHILPQKWQAAYFMNDSEETIKERIEHIGNKLPFEKKLNIIAGNGYFDKKKKEYADSVIEVTKEMSTFDSHDWKLEQISERDIRVSDAIIAILKKWDGEYKKEPITTASDQPTPEQLAFLKEAKEKGWI